MHVYIFILSFKVNDSLRKTGNLLINLNKEIYLA